MLDTPDSVVTTAVEFLSEVFDKGLKGHKEVELRKYLLYRRGLTKAQVDLAFRIYHNRIKNPKVAGNADRQEVTMPKIESGGYNFLLPTNRARGINVISKFLVMESNYCDVLECLIEEYWKHLGMMADRKQIAIPRKELEPIFLRISKLFIFHKKFWVDLKARKDKFGQLFVRHFDAFRDYVEYMKDCNNMIWRMRAHIYDKKLREALEHLRSICRRPNDEMMDLILSPIFRIKDYKSFIDDLYSLADKNQETDYQYLGKASRRIGRVVRWVDMHKHGIINKNEMNKVQQFLDTQCNIIIPHRRIVRRGMMIRRTTSLIARNKFNLFFLFNDVLLWTTRKGELQNLVFLQDSEVRPSDSKYNQAKKFEVVAKGQSYKYHKHLKLECKDPRQRNEWFDAIKKAIAGVKDVSTKDVKRNKLGEADLVKYIENISEEPKSQATDLLSPKYEKSNDQKEGEQSDTVVESEEEDEGRPVHRRLQSERNFLAQDFNDTFLPLEEMSATSETEQDLLLETEGNYGHSMSLLFPNADGTAPKRTSTFSIKRIQEQKTTSSGNIIRNKDASPKEMKIPNTSNIDLGVKSFCGNVGQPDSIIINNLTENPYSSNYPGKKKNVIYRQRQSAGSDVAASSSYTIRLNTLD